MTAPRVFFPEQQQAGAVAPRSPTPHPASSSDLDLSEQNAVSTLQFFLSLSAARPKQFVRIHTRSSSASCLNHLQGDNCFLRVMTGTGASLVLRHLPKRRSQRYRKRTPWGIERHLLDISGQTNKNSLPARTNNKHWTSQEESKLVEGVSKHGAGRWTGVWIDYFQTSNRTPVNLKDKWVNLVKACKGSVRNPRPTTAQTIASLGDVILQLDTKYAAQKAAKSKARCSAS
ncbi:hypothetical protein ACP4OV_012334 [Aristida adscensionis]